MLPQAPRSPLVLVAALALAAAAKTAAASSSKPTSDSEEPAPANSSAYEGAEYVVPTYMQHTTTILVTLHVSVFISGLVGNSLVCLSVFRNKSLQTVTNYYIVNLALADFLVILICLPPTVYWDLTLTWNFGLVLCKLVLYLQSISVSVSVLTLTCISIDRWYAICRPLEFSSTKYRAKVTIALIWLVSMLIASPDVIFLTTRRLYEEEDSVYTDCTYSWPEESTKIYQLCIVTLLFVGPFVLMSISYSHIVNVLWRNETIAESLQESYQLEEEQLQYRSRKLEREREAAARLAAPAEGQLAANAGAAAAGAETAPSSLVQPARVLIGSASNGVIVCRQPSERQARAIQGRAGARNIDPRAKAIDFARLNDSSGSYVVGGGGGGGSGDLRARGCGDVIETTRGSGAEPETPRPADAGGARRVASDDHVADGRDYSGNNNNNKSRCTSVAGRSLSFDVGAGGRDDLNERSARLIALNNLAPSEPAARPSNGRGIARVGVATRLDGHVLVQDCWSCRRWCRPRRARSRPRANLIDQSKSKSISAGGGQLAAANGNLTRKSIDWSSSPSPQPSATPSAGRQRSTRSLRAANGGGAMSVASNRPISGAALQPLRALDAGRRRPKQRGPTSSATCDATSTTAVQLEGGVAAVAGGSRESPRLAGDQQQRRYVPTHARFCKLIESRRKAAKMLIVIVIMFGLCYLPVHLINLLRYTVGLPQNEITTIASLVSHWLCYFNSAVNPLIYNLMSGKFRHEFATLFFCRCFRRAQH